MWEIKTLHNGQWVAICNYTDYTAAHEAVLSLNNGNKGIFILVKK